MYISINTKLIKLSKLSCWDKRFRWSRKGVIANEVLHYPAETRSPRNDRICFVHNNRNLKTFIFIGLNLYEKGTYQ